MYEQLFVPLCEVLFGNERFSSLGGGGGSGWLQGLLSQLFSVSFRSVPGLRCSEISACVC